MFSVRFNENLLTGFRVVICRETDRHNEANRRLVAIVHCERSRDKMKCLRTKLFIFEMFNVSAFHMQTWQQVKIMILCLIILKRRDCLEFPANTGKGIPYILDQLVIWTCRTQPKIEAPYRQCYERLWCVQLWPKGQTVISSFVYSFALL
jgi:hypothetical protein